MLRVTVCLVCLTCLGSAALADATLRRTTLLVGDLSASIAFFEAIGFTISYDNERSSDDPQGLLGGDALPFATMPTESRIVILSGPQSDSGMIGLLDYGSPDLADGRRPPGSLYQGAVILMITVDDADAVSARLTKLDAKFHSQVGPYEVRGPDGNIVATGKRMFVYNPDGHLIEVVERD